jgi:hypothetical protein
MGLESNDTNTIDGLDQTWPLGKDPTLDGDNHIRLLKRVLKAIFPGESGNGFAEPIIATEDEINHLTGITYNVADKFEEIRIQASLMLQRLGGPNNLQMLMYNTQNFTVPLGWKRVVISENYLVVATTPQYAGTYQGTDEPTSLTHNHSQSTIRIAAVNLPKHSHQFSNTSVVNTSHGDKSNYNYYISTPSNNAYTDDIGPGWGSNDPIQLPNTNNHVWQPRVAGVQLIARDINLGAN